MKGVAYSYLRFSTPEQAVGDSRRRQIALAEAYAKRHDLLLDKGLNFRDLGVSAFRGKNAKEGGLRSFLDAVEHGLVPANSYLLVESLDRLSRDRILEAQSLFLQIVTAGVTIITLLDQRSYSVASLNLNPTDLIISLVYMMRANEESETKALRLRAAWAARRDHPGNRYHGGQCPSWLRPNADRTGYDVIPGPAAIVQRIFREALAGDGLHTISRRLNEEGVPMLGRGNQKGKLWQRALIRHLINTDLVIGTYTPCRSEVVGGKARYVPIGPKAGFYPPIVSVEDWQELRDRRLAWSEYYGCGRRNMTVANVISRLAKCPLCGRPMVLVRTAEPNQRYLVCMAWREARRCSHEWVRFPEIEDVFISDISHLIARCPQPVMHVEARRAMLKALTNRLSHLRTRLAREDGVHERLATTGRPGRSWTVETKLEMEQLLAERYRLRADRSYWEDATLKLKLETLRTAVTALPRDRARINLALRSLLLKVVVDWPNDRLVLHWRHGGQSVAGFWNRRQRGTVRNVAREGPARRQPLMLPRPDMMEPGAVAAGDGWEYAGEGGFTGCVLGVLRRSGKPMRAREIALALAAAHRVEIPDVASEKLFVARVRKALFNPRPGLTRHGNPGSYRWHLVAGPSNDTAGTSPTPVSRRRRGRTGGAAPGRHPEAAGDGDHVPGVR